MNKILTFLLIIMIGFSACQDNNDNTDVAELKQEIEQLKSLLEQQHSVSDVAFEGNEMVMTFANGATIRTAAPTSIIPYIGENGNWWVNGEDLGVKAEAQVPTVGSNGNWWIGETDTGVKAQGENGVDGTDGTGIQSVDYDPETAILKIILTDGTEFEYQLFYEDVVKGVKLGDLNGKYLLKGITNGDFPFADFIYNAKNQLTDINYYVSLLNAPVKNASLIRTYANDKIETQSLVEYAIKDKAVQVDDDFPGTFWDDILVADVVNYNISNAFDELFPTGIANYNGTKEDFFRNYNRIVKDGYIYKFDDKKNVVAKQKTFNNEEDIKPYLLTEDNGKYFIHKYPQWNYYSSSSHYNRAYNVSGFTASEYGYILYDDSDVTAYTLEGYHGTMPAIAYTDEIDIVTEDKILDYETFPKEEIDNPKVSPATTKCFTKNTIAISKVMKSIALILPMLMKEKTQRYQLKVKTYTN